VRETPPALEKRRQPGRIRAIILAVAVHAIFFALIVFGITWQSRPTPPVEVELWDKLPPAKSVAAKPQPEPEPPKAEPPKPEPPKPEVKPEPPKLDPAIAERKEREKREKEKKERLEREKKEKLEKQKQEDAKKKREEEKRRQEEEKAREAAAVARQSELDRYKLAIQAKIKGKANVPDTVTGNPELIVRIRVLPGGDVLDATITKPSGNRAYDAAIERAIRSAQPLPVPPADSELFPQFRDLSLKFTHER